MATEIERKYLVANDDWRGQAEGVPYRQAYLSIGKATVRVRIAGVQAFLTIKGPRVGLARPEFEYEIPVDDATEMLTLARSAVVEKTRYKIVVDGMTWEVDEFHGANAGLVVAEIELTDEQQTFTEPGWLGQEVSDDGRYTNAQLSIKPYSEW